MPTHGMPKPEQQAIHLDPADRVKAPLAADVIGYFASMGYRLATVPTPGNETGGQWQLDSRLVNRHGKLFSTLSHLWHYWRLHAAWVLSVDMHYRLLCAWYRAGTEDERTALRAWTCGPTDADDLQEWACGRVASWEDFTVDTLPHDWIEFTRDVELGSDTAGEGCRYRFRRFIGQLS